MIHILTNISRSKGNETIKFGQLIKYNMRNIKKKKTQNVMEKLFSNPLLKNNNSAYPWINSLQFYSLFLLYAKLRAIGICQN